jgi:hypothetical protein
VSNTFLSIIFIKQTIVKYIGWVPLVLKKNELRDSVKEGESKGKGSRMTIRVSKKGKERAINVEGDSILRELIWEEKQRIEGKMSILQGMLDNLSVKEKELVE